MKEFNDCEELARYYEEQCPTICEKEEDDYEREITTHFELKEECDEV